MGDLSDRMSEQDGVTSMGCQRPGIPLTPSDTPLCDSLAVRVIAYGGRSKVFVPYESARLIERERNEAREALRIAEKYLVDRGVEVRGIEGRTVVLPAIRKALGIQ
jgi:hypothetical protein